jgi:uroporphyrinogen decarboxylase
LHNLSLHNSLKEFSMGEALMSRSRALAAINHELPDRIPVSVGGITTPKPYAERLNLSRTTDLPECGSGEGLYHLTEPEAQALKELRGALGLDLARCAPKYTGPELTKWFSHWGTIAQGPNDPGYSQSRIGNPLEGVTTLKQVESFAWPSVQTFDYAGLRKAAQEIGDKARVLSIGWEPVFNRVLDLFGMEDAMMKLHLQPEFIEAAVAHIEEHILARAERALRAAADLFDIFGWGDDFATHRGLFISPEHWRRFFAPSYRRLIELVKSYGLKFNLHCCGTFIDVLPDLVDMGVDIWHPCQVHLPGNEPEFLKREFGEHLTFCGAINTQNTLPFGTIEDVRREVRERIAVLGRGGGYICSPDHDVLPEVPVDNLFALLDEAKKNRNPLCVRE